MGGTDPTLGSSWRGPNRMCRAPRVLLACLLGGAAIVQASASNRAAQPAFQSAQKVTPKAAGANAPTIPNDFEIQAEQRLLVLANQSRRQAGAPPLILDAGLTQAARIHARAMLQARQISHQFDGEASLQQRLAAATKLQLDQEGENVALDYSAEGGHQHLMLSPPHRANLLNPNFNVVGMGVVRSGDQLYIVQDFGHALPNYSVADVKNQVAAAVNQMRRQASQPELQRRDLPAADDAACSMAKADKVATAPVHNLAQRFTVISYTSLHSEMLPSGAAHAIGSQNMTGFSVGACYGKTNTYPTGVYWVVLALE
jgi:uncharacterized protein YkwD